MNSQFLSGRFETRRRRRRGRTRKKKTGGEEKGESVWEGWEMRGKARLQRKKKVPGERASREMPGEGYPPTKGGGGRVEGRRASGRGEGGNHKVQQSLGPKVRKKESSRWGAKEEPGSWRRAAQRGRGRLNKERTPGKGTRSKAVSRRLQVKSREMTSAGSQVVRDPRGR